MFPALKITKAQRQLNGGGFQEGNVEVFWPERGIVGFARSLRPARFYQLMSFHRPVYAASGHRGPSNKQRFGHKRDMWRRQFRLR